MVNDLLHLRGVDTLDLLHAVLDEDVRGARDASIAQVCDVRHFRCWWYGSVANPRRGAGSRPRHQRRGRQTSIWDSGRTDGLPDRTALWFLRPVSFSQGRSAMKSCQVCGNRAYVTYDNGPGDVIYACCQSHLLGTQRQHFLEMFL